jgi:hypothetical protein
VRFVVAGVACVSAGAAVAVSVAWGFALWGALADFTVKIHHGDRDRYDFVTRAPDLSQDDLGLCSRLIPDITPATDLWLGLGSGVGLRDIRVSATEPGKVRYAMVHQTGWPLPAFEYRYLGAPVGSWPARPTGWRAPAWMVRETYTTLAWDTTGRPPVPLRPILSGLALDSGFYAAVLAGLAALPVAGCAFVTRRRERRGLCPSCAYPRAGTPPSAPCPECGCAAGTTAPR